MHHAEFDGAHLHDFGTERGKLEHFLVSDFVHAVGFRHHARIRGVNAVHVGVDVAALGADRCSDRHCRGVGTAAPERGDAAGCLVHALKAGNDRDLVVDDQLLGEPLGIVGHRAVILEDDVDLLPRGAGAVLLLIEPDRGVDLPAGPPPTTTNRIADAVWRWAGAFSPGSTT